MIFGTKNKGVCLSVCTFTEHCKTAGIGSSKSLTPIKEKWRALGNRYTRVTAGTTVYENPRVMHRGKIYHGKCKLPQL